MKKTLMTFIFTILFTILLTGNVHAQTYPFYPYPIFPPCFPMTCGVQWVYAPTTTPTPIITPTVTPTPTTQVVTPTPTPITLSPTPTAGPSATPSPTPITGDLKKGAYVGDGIENLTAVDQFESMTQKALDVILVYQAWEGDWKDFRPQWINNASANGSIAMITWEPWNYSFGVNQPSYKLSNITAGNFDTHITNYARAAKATSKTIYLRPMHEMNGNWYPWAESVNGNQSGDYVRAWKHIVNIFRNEGASNVKFVWCPNVNYSGSTPLAQVFPGDDYIDYTCMDGYNWGYGNGEWQTFSTIFQNTYNQLTTMSSKPVIIGEMASAEQNGNKATWITDAYAKAKTWNRLVLVNWFNANKERDWRVNSSTKALNAFKNAIK